MLKYRYLLLIFEISVNAHIYTFKLLFALTMTEEAKTGGENVVNSYGW